MISENITYKEAIRSNTATRLSIENTPSDLVLQNMKTIAEKVFQPLRNWVDGPIRINSFFRCEDLNTAIGGSKRSQHCRGQAMDLDDVHGHATNAEMFKYIKNNLDFDQLIWEFGNDKNPDWIHVSYVDSERNRNRCLKALKSNGKTKYELI